MINDNESICPSCGGDLRYYDKVERILRTKGRVSRRVEIRRLRCLKCGKVHRELTNDIFPYKQYETEVIRGVLEGLITCETLGYEDYPCETTMVRWRGSQNLQSIL
jgi:uncharacterized Zn finger protein